MPSRQTSHQTSRSSRALASGATEAENSAAAPRRSRRTWGARLRLALIPFAGVLGVAYLAGLALSLFAPQAVGLSLPTGGANWTNSLGYPLAATNGIAQSWPYGVFAGVLLVVYGACVLGVRLFEPRSTRVAPAVPAPAIPAPAPAAAAPAVSSGPIGPVLSIWPAAEPQGELQPASAVAAAAIGDASPASAPAPDTQQPSTAGEPSIFISHNSGDNPFGFALADHLRQALGNRAAVWYDSRGGPGADGEWEGGIPPAAYFQDEIVRELTSRDVFVVILSERAMQSKWVHDEIALAWSQKNSADVTRGKVIVPVLRQTCKVPPLVALVQYVDFRPEADQAKALQDLLYAIRLGRTRPAPAIELGPPFDLGLLPPLERFVGRTSDVQRVLALLTEASGKEGQIASVAAANGLGGIGKTALATEVVRRLMATTAFPDGIGVVICKGLTDPVEILRSVLARFSPDRRPPDDVAIPALADRARQLFRGKHALVVLDNVEQGWPVREVIQPLRAAGAAVLLTSRAELAAVPREASVKLEVLPLDEALDVFAEYYGRGAALDLTRPELAAATTIVESLGRHTLAVKLAAANAATLGRPLEVVARELELNPRRALLLADSDEAVRFVLESSYDALSQRAQRLFVTLGAFATSDIGRIALLEVTRVLREEVVDDEDDQQAAAEVEAALREVVALRLADTAVDERIPPDADRERLRLHPLVRTYAEELLGRQDEAQRDEAQRVIAAFYADYANAVADLALGPDEANVIGAIEWAHAHDDDLVLARLCRGIADFWRDTGRVQAGMTYLPWGAAAAERVAERTDERADRLRAITISGFYADLLRGMGRLSEAEALYLRDLDARRALGDRDGEATALSDLGEIALMKGHSVEAEQYGLQALEIVRDLHSRREEEAVLTILGRVALRQGHVEDAEDYFQQALAIDREVHNRHDEAVDLAYLGQVALQRGSLEDAADRFSKALEIMREVDDRRSAGGVLFTLGAIAERRERIEEAEHYYHLSLEIRRQVQDLQGELVTLNSLAGLAQRQGRPEEAQRLYEQSLDVARDVGDRAGEGVTLFQLAQIAEERGDLDRAEKLHRQSLAIGREIENVRDIADSLRELGRFLIVRRENLEEGRQMLAEAADLYAQLGATDREQEIRKILSELESR